MHQIVIEMDNNKEVPSPLGTYLRVINRGELNNILNTGLIMPSINDWGIEPKTVSFYFVESESLPFRYVRSFIDDTLLVSDNACAMILFRCKQNVFIRDASATDGFNSVSHEGPLDLRSVLNLKVFEINKVDLLQYFDWMESNQPLF